MHKFIIITVRIIMCKYLSINWKITGGMSKIWELWTRNKKKHNRKILEHNRLKLNCKNTAFSYACQKSETTIIICPLWIKIQFFIDFLYVVNILPLH